MKNKTSYFIFALVFLAFFSTSNVYSQENNEIINTEENSYEQPEKKLPSAHQIYLGYGYPGSLYTKFLSGAVNFFSVIASVGNQEEEQISYGIAQLGYDWFCIPGQGLSVGALATVEPYTIKIINNSSETKIENQTMITFQANVKYQYGWKFVKLYHGLSAGIGLMILETDLSPIFVFNIIPIGVKVGNEQGLNFYADIGFITTPIINAGASYRF